MAPVLVASAAAASPALLCASKVLVSVPLIVKLAVRGSTCPTTRSPCAACLVLDREFAYRLRQPAAGADLRDGRVARGMCLGGNGRRRLRRDRARERGRTSDLPPVELLRRSALMTVRTAHVAFLDLQQNQAPRLMSGHHADVALLLCRIDRKSTRLNSSHVAISYAVFCLKKKKTT